jgi:hypothetical protein
MSVAPSVLVLDDGELDHFQIALRRLGVDFDRRVAGRSGVAVEMPRDILLTTWRRAVKMPPLQMAPGVVEEPVRVCVHGQDFLPLRERLRDEGFHFLVHSLVHPESLRLFLLQLLYRGVERRGGVRLPVVCEATCEVGSERMTVNLIDLSLGAARLLSPCEVPADLEMTLYLPPQLSGDKRIGIPGRSVRCVPFENEGSLSGFCFLVEFTDLSASTRSHLEGCLAGDHLGSQFTPLESLPNRAREGEPDFATNGGEDMRRNARVEYARTVPTLSSIGNSGADVVLGSDLSLQGIRLAPHEGLAVGSRLTLALHGSSRGAPLLLEADVVRDDGERGLGLRFVLLSPADKDELARLIAELKPIESLRDREGEPLVVSQIVTPNP